MKRYTIICMVSLFTVSLSGVAWADMDEMGSMKGGSATQDTGTKDTDGMKGHKHSTKDMGSTKDTGGAKDTGGTKDMSGTKDMGGTKGAGSAKDAGGTKDTGGKATMKGMPGM